MKIQIWGENDQIQILAPLAYSIQTIAQEDSNGNTIIKGTQRWIGQGTIANIYVVWARNLKTNEIQGYLVEKFRKWLTHKKMKEN